MSDMLQNVIIILTDSEADHITSMLSIAKGNLQGISLWTKEDEELHYNIVNKIYEEQHKNVGLNFTPLKPKI